MSVKSECGKCGGNTWEAHPDHIENIKTQMAVVRCKSCKTAIGVIDLETSDKVRRIGEAIRIR